MRDRMEPGTNGENSAESAEDPKTAAGSQDCSCAEARISAAAAFRSAVAARFVDDAARPLPADHRRVRLTGPEHHCACRNERRAPAPCRHVAHLAQKQLRVRRIVTVAP